MKRLIVLALAALIIITTGMTVNLLADEECPLDLWWDMDLPGSDFRNFIIRTDNAMRDKKRYAREARECRASCGRDHRCRAWTYSPIESRCYLKDNVPRPVIKGTFISGVLAPPPVRDNSVSAGQIGVDRPGGDYRSFNLQRADSRLCQQACNKDQRCLAWAMTKPNRNNPQAHCWLKDSVPQQQPNENVVSGIKP